MRKSIIRMILAILFAVLLCGIQSKITLQAMEYDEIDALQLRMDESGKCVFANYNELKELASKSYDGFVSIYYEGEEELVIEEDLTIPVRLDVHVDSVNVKIPAGVTLTINQGINVSDILVEGTVVINSYATITNKLEIVGEVIVNGQLSLGSEVQVIGEDKVNLVNESSNTLLWLYDDVTSVEFKEALKKASANTNPYVAYSIDTEPYSNIVIDESLVAPENVHIIVNYGSIRIAKNGSLDFYGRISGMDKFSFMVEGNLNNAGSISEGIFEVKGSLNNTGRINIPAYSTFTIADGGSYTGTGRLFAYYVDEADIPNKILGVDLTKFTIKSKTNGCELRLATGFSDVIEDAYYEAPVLWAVENGITNGYGSETTFCPELTCTRGQIATFLWRAKGCPEPASLNNPFSDVGADAYYYKAVLWAVEQGITQGYGSSTTFCPDLPCTRGQVATFMWRAESEPVISGSNPFTDVTAGAYYSDAVLWAVENGITNGYGSDTIFNPEGECTRGQIVTFLYRGMN